MKRLIGFLAALMFVLSAAQADEVKVQQSTLEEQSSGSNIFVYQTTIYVRPPFYSGQMPLILKVGKKPTGFSGEMTTVYQEFDKWRNTFTYSDPSLSFSGIADGARTTDNSGRLLAKAKLSRVIKGEGIEIEEFHYDSDGNVRFSCKSKFDFGVGFKKSETDIQGIKEKDYYFLWPTSQF